MKSLRTHETQEAYRKSRALPQGCGICDGKSIKDFSNWRIIPNRYPYDLIAEKHHMLVSKRHVSETELTDEEMREFREIKDKFIDEYEFILEPTKNRKTIPYHFHIHLLITNADILEFLDDEVEPETANR